MNQADVLVGYVMLQEVGFGASLYKQVSDKQGFAHASLRIVLNNEGLFVWKIIFLLSVYNITN